jgi:hypothetical protein
LILGIAATLMALSQFLTLLSIPVGIAGAIYGILGIVAANRGAPGRWMAIGGLILSVVLPGWFIWWIATGCGAGC